MRFLEWVFGEKRREQRHCEVLAALGELKDEVRKMTTTLDQAVADITAAVTANVAEGQVIISALNTAINDLKNAQPGDQSVQIAALENLAGQLTANTTSLAAAVAPPAPVDEPAA
jgi:Na+/H+-translocating membrane pyrophosphatase